MAVDQWDVTAAVEPPAVEVKLFGRWNPDDVQVTDISLQVSNVDVGYPITHRPLSNSTHFQDYICIKEKGAVFLPHTAGRYAMKRFRKAQVRELVDAMYMALLFLGKVSNCPSR